MWYKIIGRDINIIVHLIVIQSEKIIFKNWHLRFCFCTLELRTYFSLSLDYYMPASPHYAHRTDKTKL